MAEDRRLEIAERRRRFQPQLFVQGAAELAVGVESLGLPAAAVEGEHELAAKTLPQGMVSHHPAQFSSERTRQAQRQLRLVPFFQAGQLKLLQPGNLGLCEGLVAE